MKPLMNNQKLLFIPLVLAALACSRDKLDFKMIDDLAFRPEIEAPLISARLTLNDLVKQDSGLFVVNPDNSLRIKYREDRLFSFNVLDFVRIPDQPSNTIPMFVGAPAYDFDLTLATLGGVELHKAEWATGHLQLSLNSAAPQVSDLSVEFTIKSASRAGSVLKKTITLPAGATSVSDSLSLVGSEFDFTNGGGSVNHLGLKAELTNAGLVLPGTQVDLTTQFRQLAIENTEGYFGERNINIPSGDFNFDVSSFKDLVDGFFLKSPSVKLIMASTVGVGLELTPDFSGVNKEGAITALNAPAQQINAAQTVAVYDTSILDFNPVNSNVVDFIAALPSQVLYGGKARLNPNGRATNFIHRNSEMAVGVEIDLPLELSIDNMKMKEVLSDIDLFRENPEQVEALTLIFNSSNGFPFDLSLSAAFLDSVAPHDSLQGFNLGLLKAATIGANGEILQRGEFTMPQEVSIDGDLLEKLKRCDKMQITATLNTSEGSTKVEKFYTHFDVEINIAARAKLNLKLKDQ